MAVAHKFAEKARTNDVLISETIDFSGLLLSAPVLHGLKNSGFERPSPIQLKAIPLGRCGLDLIVQAKSGTGKTCVFSVIALESIETTASSTQVLVLAPTREIAIQIWEVIGSLGSAMPALQCHTFIGGLPLHEDKKKLQRCHIAVGTPGRVQNLIEHGCLKTESIRLFILDEADKLLEESFQKQINWIYSALPDNKQMLALSATYPEYLAEHLTVYMRNPTFVRLNISDPTLLGIKQFYTSVANHPLPHRVFEAKTEAVVNLLSSVSFHQCLIFSNMQTRAQNLESELTSRGWPTTCIAGCLDQKDRITAMAKLKSYECRVLISTDLTSRGIDADRVNLVINLDVPKDHETYLHRIGRAGRFGSYGAGVTIISEGQERLDMQAVEGKIGTHILLLPDPIPSDLVKRQLQVNLDDVVSTEQLVTRSPSGETQPISIGLVTPTSAKVSHPRGLKGQCGGEDGEDSQSSVLQEQGDVNDAEASQPPRQDPEASQSSRMQDLDTSQQCRLQDLEASQPPRQQNHDLSPPSGLQDPDVFQQASVQDPDSSLLANLQDPETLQYSRPQDQCDMKSSNSSLQKEFESTKDAGISEDTHTAALACDGSIKAIVETVCDNSSTERNSQETVGISLPCDTQGDSRSQHMTQQTLTGSGSSQQALGETVPSIRTTDINSQDKLSQRLPEGSSSMAVYKTSASISLDGNTGVGAAGHPCTDSFSAEKGEGGVELGTCVSNNCIQLSAATDFQNSSGIHSDAVSSLSGDTAHSFRSHSVETTSQDQKLRGKECGNFEIKQIAGTHSEARPAKNSQKTKTHAAASMWSSMLSVEEPNRETESPEWRPDTSRSLGPSSREKDNPKSHRDVNVNGKCEDFSWESELAMYVAARSKLNKEKATDPGEEQDSAGGGDMFERPKMRARRRLANGERKMAMSHTLQNSSDTGSKSGQGLSPEAPGLIDRNCGLTLKRTIPQDQEAGKAAGVTEEKVTSVNGHGEETTSPPAEATWQASKQGRATDSELMSKHMNKDRQGDVFPGHGYAKEIHRKTNGVHNPSEADHLCNGAMAPPNLCVSLGGQRKPRAPPLTYSSALQDYESYLEQATKSTSLTPAEIAQKTFQVPEKAEESQLEQLSNFLNNFHAQIKAGKWRPRTENERQEFAETGENGLAVDVRTNGGMMTETSIQGFNSRNDLASVDTKPGEMVSPETIANTENKGRSGVVAARRPRRFHPMAVCGPVTAHMFGTKDTAQVTSSMNKSEDVTVAALAPSENNEQRQGKASAPPSADHTEHSTVAGHRDLQGVSVHKDADALPGIKGSHISSDHKGRRLYPAEDGGHSTMQEVKPERVTSQQKTTGDERVDPTVVVKKEAAEPQAQHPVPPQGTGAIPKRNLSVKKKIKDSSGDTSSESCSSSSLSEEEDTHEEEGKKNSMCFQNHYAVESAVKGRKVKLSARAQALRREHEQKVRQKLQRSPSVSTQEGLSQKRHHGRHRIRNTGDEAQTVNSIDGAPTCTSWYPYGAGQSYFEQCQASADQEAADSQQKWTNTAPPQMPNPSWNSYTYSQCSWQSQQGAGARSYPYSWYPAGHPQVSNYHCSVYPQQAPNFSQYQRLGNQYYMTQPQVPDNPYVYPPQMPSDPYVCPPPQAPNNPNSVYPPQATNSPYTIYPPQAPSNQYSVYLPQTPSNQYSVYPPQAPNNPYSVYPQQMHNNPFSVYPSQAPYHPNTVYPPQAPDSQQHYSSSWQYHDQLHRQSAGKGPGGHTSRSLAELQAANAARMQSYIRKMSRFYARFCKWES